MKLGDLLIHEGSAKHAQKFAAKVFNADKTYFVLNGTSAANKVVTNALLTRGDLVLFDRNNHKSNHHGALIQAGGRRLFTWKPRAIRSALSAALTSAALMSITCGISSAKRRLRSQCLPPVSSGGDPAGDPTARSNARQVVDKIGHLCVTSCSTRRGWAMSSLSMMADCSPLLLELTPRRSGYFFVTQSVHKQQAAHRRRRSIKDNHLRGRRVCRTSG